MEETPSIKGSGDLNLTIESSQPQSFTISNGINNTQKQFKISDIEMVAIHSLTYTSLRDLLPVSQPSMISPTTYNRKESWREIQIKDPLVKHAAWAYLQPMTTAQESDDRNCFLKLKDGCCGLSGCFGGLLDDVVVRMIKRWFTDVEVEVDTENENEEDDHHHDKVD